MEIIKIIVGVLTFVLGWCIWVKVVDKIDESLKNKLSKKLYNRTICILFITIFALIIYSITK